MRPYQSIISQEFDWETPPHGYVGEVVFRQQVGKDGLLKLYTNLDHSNFTIREYNLDSQLKDTIDLTNDYKYFNASYRDIINDVWSVRGGLTYTTNTDDIVFNSFNFTDRTKGWHAKVAANWDGHSKLSLNAGVELITNHFERRLGEAPSTDIFQFQDNLTAGFAELDFFASNRFVVRTGLRLEHSSLLRDTWMSPRIAASYKATEKGTSSPMENSISKHRMSTVLLIRAYDQKWQTIISPITNTQTLIKYLELKPFTKTTIT